MSPSPIAGPSHPLHRPAALESLPVDPCFIGETMIANSTLQQMQAREAYLHQPSRTHCRGCGQRLSDAE